MKNGRRAGKTTGMLKERAVTGLLEKRTLLRRGG